MPDDTAPPVRVFICYAREDDRSRIALRNHLTTLVRSNIIELFDDSAVQIGQEWDDTIKKKLAAAELIIFLVSADFEASLYINEVEVEAALQRHKAGKAYLLPVLVRSIDVNGSRLGPLQFWPRAAEQGLLPIEEWAFKDRAFTQIIQEIRRWVLRKGDETRSANQREDKQSNEEACDDIDRLADCDRHQPPYRWRSSDERLRLLADLQPSATQGSTRNYVLLNVELRCGEDRISGQGLTFAIGLGAARLKLHLDDCEVAPNSRFGEHVPSTFQVTASDKGEMRRCVTAYGGDTWQLLPERVGGTLDGLVLGNDNLCHIVARGQEPCRIGISLRAWRSDIQARLVEDSRRLGAASKLTKLQAKIIRLLLVKGAHIDGDEVVICSSTNHEA